MSSNRSIALIAEVLQGLVVSRISELSSAAQESLSSPQILALLMTQQQSIGALVEVILNTPSAQQNRHIELLTLIANTPIAQRFLDEGLLVFINLFRVDIAIEKYKALFTENGYYARTNNWIEDGSIMAHAEIFFSDNVVNSIKENVVALDEVKRILTEIKDSSILKLLFSDAGIAAIKSGMINTHDIKHYMLVSSADMARNLKIIISEVGVSAFARNQLVRHGKTNIQNLKPWQITSTQALTLTSYGNICIGNLDLFFSANSKIALENNLLTIEQYGAFEPHVLKKVLSDNSITALTKKYLTVNNFRDILPLTMDVILSNNGMEYLQQIEAAKVKQLQGGDWSDKAIESLALSAVDNAIVIFKRFRDHKILALMLTENGQKAVANEFITYPQAIELSEIAASRNDSKTPELLALLISPLGRALHMNGLLSFDFVKNLSADELKLIMSPEGLIALSEGAAMGGNTSIHTIEELIQECETKDRDRNCPVKNPLPMKLPEWEDSINERTAKLQARLSHEVYLQFHTNVTPGELVKKLKSLDNINYFHQLFFADIAAIYTPLEIILEKISILEAGFAEFREKHLKNNRPLQTTEVNCIKLLKAIILDLLKEFLQTPGLTQGALNKLIEIILDNPDAILNMPAESSMLSSLFIKPNKFEELDKATDLIRDVMILSREQHLLAGKGRPSEKLESIETEVSRLDGVNGLQP